ncbi:uncharacterized protein LOC136038906 [Artemia franciscana]|uniref:Uncharacterized protein n=1 Tax=Artemia franciscana TaxID=6661 RepID=A0AA88I975_ARTSF|nr:hypothetical protein QYM36_006410 [Artemia franciscana]
MQFFMAILAVLALSNAEQEKDGEAPSGVEEVQPSEYPVNSNVRRGRNFYYAVSRNTPAVVPLYSPFVYNYYQRPQYPIVGYPMNFYYEPTDYSPHGAYATPNIPSEAIRLADTEKVPEDVEQMLENNPRERFLFLQTTLITSGSTTSTIKNLCKFNIFSSGTICFNG